MIKIKYQDGFTKLIASKLGQLNKARFSKNIEENLSSLSKTNNDKKISISVISFSCKRDFYDQILSILSFLRYAGTPNSWIIYSDGSIEPYQINLLNKRFDFVEVISINWTNSISLKKYIKGSFYSIERELIDYAQHFPLGKKLFCFLNHPIEEPSLFLDSDILFYHRATVLQHLINDKISGWYLPDPVWGCLDSRYKKNNPEQLYQVNSGFFFLQKEISHLDDGIDFFKSLRGKYEYFSEQSVFHILFRSNNFMPLDPRIFIISSKDQFDFAYLNSRENTAIRHFTGPVRHKMWQKNWKWQLSI